MKSFKSELSALLNKWSKENGSDTPDFILAKYLMACLVAFDAATKLRTEWYEPPTQESSDINIDKK